ncbi:PRAME family member 12-like [Dipodomys merriami]|uniref:PRAME family member 12-like n=1 Tax=Dipodomys merriami TaxID=94247 RepID=UPI0038558D68
MILDSNEGNSEQNEIQNLQEKLEATRNLGKGVSRSSMGAVDPSSNAIHLKGSAHTISVSVVTAVPAYLFPSRMKLLLSVNQSLLSNQSLSISALEDLPAVLFPLLFMEIYKEGYTEMMKAMVQAWPLPCLPLGDLVESPDLETFKAVLDGIDLLLAKRERPNRWKLQVLDLRNDHPNIWIQGYHSMAQISYTDVLTDRPTESCGSMMTEEQPLMVIRDLTIKDGTQNALQAHLLQWARKTKERVQLCSRKLRILSGSVSKIQKALGVVRLDSIQELVVSEFWLPGTLRIFTLYLGHMKNLLILTCSSMWTDIPHSHENSQYPWIIGGYLGCLKHLQELHVHNILFIATMPTILRSLPPLKMLSLSSCALPETDLRFLSQYACTRQLKHLHLRTLPMKRTEPLRAFLEHVACTLETLALEECYITDAQLSAILPTLSQCSQLRFFSFYGNCISMATLQNLLSHMARLGHLRRGFYPAPLESYHPEDWYLENFDPGRFAEVGAAVVQTLRDVGTNQKVQICTSFCHHHNTCQLYSLTLDGTWVVTEEDLTGLSALPV